MTLGPRAIRREAIDRILEKPRIVEKLGRAVWLYVDLVSAASREGLVCRSLERLSKDLSVSEEKITEWLDRLVQTNLALVTAPAPFLVIRLKTWPGSGLEKRLIDPESRPQSSSSHNKVPVSSSKQAALAISKQSEDGGLGEGTTLLDEALKTLDESDRDAVQQILNRYTEPLIRRALARVENTPPGQIRKSRLALFRYLLNTFSNESRP